MGAQNEPLSHFEEYLSEAFKDSYEYPLGSIIFHSIIAVTRSGIHTTTRNFEIYTFTPFL